MDDVVIEFTQTPKLKAPIFIEGLPGVGNVGKLAAEHLIDELGAKKFADIYSRYFPPQVLVDDQGLVKLVNNELYFHKAPKGGSDLIFLVGDYQGLTPEGQYSLSDNVLDVMEKFKVKMIFTLGGYGLGKMINEPNVLGAATSEKLIKEMKKLGVLFKEGEPGSGIVGASGLLLGLGILRGFDGVCLMGETSGYFVDPKSAQAVLEILVRALGVEVDYTKLEEKAQQIEKLEKHLKDLEGGGHGGDPSGDDLQYIG